MADTTISLNNSNTGTGKAVPIAAVDYNGDQTKYALAAAIVSGGGGGITVACPSSSFTRPANTTAYVSGQLVANSTTAGSVTPLSWTAARVAAGSFRIPRIRFYKSSTGVTGSVFEVHLYATSPTVVNGDGATFSDNKMGSADYLGCFIVTVDQVGSAGVSGIGVPKNGSAVETVLASGQTIYGLVKAAAAYAPGNGETIGVVLEIEQN
jgi:hypothetical protein